MTRIDNLRAALEKLSARANQAKMNLHDLSEALAVAWKSIPHVAARTHAAFAMPAARRDELKKLGSG